MTPRERSARELAADLVAIAEDDLREAGIQAFGLVSLKSRVSNGRGRQVTGGGCWRRRF